jgi:cytochrome P450
MVEAMGALDTPWGTFQQKHILAANGADHERLRRVLAPAFTPRQANRHRPLMREVISQLLDEWAPKGAFDFEEFAANFPISVMFRLVGAPVEEIAAIRTSLETLGLAFSMDRDRIPEIHAAFDRLEKLVQRIIAERRASGKVGTYGDLLDLLISVSDEGEVPDRQLEDLVIFFFIAGYDTSKNVLTHTMWKLLDRPEIYERCATDTEYCRKVLEEGLRVFNPGSVPRFTDEDIVYRDVLLPKDTMLWFTLNVSGRDEIVFDDADSFDPDREVGPGKRHLAFSLGKHTCLGQYIARAQLQEALHQCARRLKNPRLAGPFGWRPYPGAWGLKGLPIEFDPA